MEGDHRMLCAVIGGGLLFYCSSVHAYMHVHNVFMFLCHNVYAEVRRKL